MRKRLQIALFAFLIGISGLIVWHVSHDNEPVYRGRALSAWLQTYDPSSRFGRGSPQWNETDNAVRQIGTNSIPVLLRMLRATDSKLKLQLIALARKQRVVKIHFVSAAVRNIEASRAFIPLGDRAKDAVPGLMRIYTENNSGESLNAVEEALGWIGPAAKPAIPLLLAAATNSNSRVRASALWALGEIHSEPLVCVPELVRALGDSDAWTQVSAAHALGMFGADARAAVSALTQLAGSTNTGKTLVTTRLQVQMEASRALHKISPDSFAPNREPDFELAIPTAGTLFTPP